ncbi:class I adenylate-forming enzyme family protein [Aquisalibacillus elongatus]|uniref:class I adenylate-forming enzyme family protein n=1 Tax=Aquisalibacillus elongatus TaxID=485577 RepID=UPI000F527587|nr:AMP-binding protein [Aquisalibacillus elongatus]
MHPEIDWIGKRAQLFEDDIAVIDADTDTKWTYKEMNERAIQLAVYLIDHQVEKGDRVALLAPNHVSYFDFLFACKKIGAIFVPLNWRLAQEELEYVINDASPKFIAIHDEFEQTHEWIESNLVIHHNQYIDQVPTTEKLELKLKLPFVDIEEKDPLAMIYTGGTTGKPKGAVLSHQSIFWNAINTIISWDLNQHDCTLTTIPMFHTGGLNALSTPVLLAGGTVVLRSNFDPEEAVEDLIRYRCSVVLFIPTMYHMIVQTDAFQNSTFPDMNVFLSGGAPCPLTVYQAFEEKGLKFKEGYGLTEAGPNNFYIDPDVAKTLQGSVGREMVFNQIRIMNEGQEAEANEVGELWLKGKHLFEYYWNNEDETDQAFHDDWFKTGDLARKDEDGYVYIAGRKKEMIISGGENIYPLEIEHWLQSHESINEVAVVGLPHEKWGEVVAAFVSQKGGETLSEDELKDYCQKKLSRYKIPKQFHIIDELPKTHVGKINKKALVNEQLKQ